MKQIITIILFCFATIMASSQQMQFNWITQAGGPGWDVVTDITELPEGQLAVAGAFYESISFQSDTLQSKGSRDIFIAIYAADGSLGKTTSIGGEGFDYVKQIEANGKGLIVPVRFDHVTEVSGRSFESSFSNNILMAWLDEEFNLAHDFLFSSTKEFDLTGIKSLPDGSCIFSGWFTDTLKVNDQIYQSKNGKDSFGGKLSPEGKLKWFRHFEGNGEELITALAANEAGDKFYFCGTTGEEGFPGVKIPFTVNKGQQLLFLAETSGEGEPLKTEYILSGTDIQALEILADSTSAWIITNFKHTVATYDRRTISSMGNSDALVLSYNFTDSTLLHCQVGGQGNTSANRLVCSGKNLLLTGQYSGKIAFGTENIESAGRGTDIFIAMLGNNVTPLTIFTFTGESNEFPCSAFAAESGVYVTGEFKGELKAGNTGLVSAGKEDIFLSKVENCAAGNLVDIEITVLDESEEETVWELDAGAAFVSYLWNDGLSGSRHLITNQPGTYTVTVSDFFGCIYTAEVVLMTEKSAQIDLDEQAVGFKIYPTVTSGLVYWEPATSWENFPVTVSVFDAAGRKITRQEPGPLKPQQYSINLAGETEGTYLVEISGEEFREVTKVMVKK